MYGKVEIACAINLKNPDQDDEDSIRQIIPEECLGVEIETPLSLFMFEQDIIRFAEEQGRHVMVVSFRECLMVGERLKMTSEVINLIPSTQDFSLLSFHFSKQCISKFHCVCECHSPIQLTDAIQPLTTPERCFCREGISGTRAQETVHQLCSWSELHRMPANISTLCHI